MALHVPSGIYVPAVSHGEKREEGEKCPPVWDVLLIALAIGAFGYMLLNYSRIAQSGGYLTNGKL